MKNFKQLPYWIFGALGISLTIFLAGTAEAAHAPVQTKVCNGGNYVNTYNCTFDAPVTAGNLITYTLTSGSANTIGSIAGNSNTYTLATSTTTSGDRTNWLYYAKNVNGGTTTVATTFGAAQFADSALIMREYSGLDRTSPLDQVVAGNDVSSFLQTHTTPASGVTSQANELIVVGGGASASSSAVSYAAGSGYGNLTTQNGYDIFTSSFLEDKTVSTTGTQTGTWTSTGFVKGLTTLATFKDAAVSATSTNAIFFAGD